MFIIIEFESSEKGEDSDGTLIQSNLRHSVPAEWHLHNKCPLWVTVLPTGIGELDFKEFYFAGGFW